VVCVEFIYRGRNLVVSLKRLIGRKPPIVEVSRAVSLTLTVNSHCDEVVVRALKHTANERKTQANFFSRRL
jgi:uncharacterized UPF0146 family protein